MDYEIFSHNSTTHLYINYRGIICSRCNARALIYIYTTMKNIRGRLPPRSALPRLLLFRPQQKNCYQAQGSNHGCLEQNA
jgi:hypothetical protein